MVACKNRKQVDKVMPAAEKIESSREPSREDTLAYLQIASASQQVLGKNLVGKIEGEGTLAALAFCSERAYPLTDSLSRAQGVKIRRVTDKARNPDNLADEREHQLMDRYRDNLADGKKLKPVFYEEEGARYFYSPILTNALCLQCHGVPGEKIEPGVIARIRKLYPNDRAIDYQENQARGLWRIIKETE